MSYKKHYTEETRERALALLDEGYTTREVAELLGVEAQSIYKWKSRRKAKEKAYELLDEGYAPREVAAKLGVASQTIYNWKSGREAKESKLSAPEAERAAVNPLLSQLAAGNDLSKWAGREVLSLQPRELFALLRALNIEGELTLTQKVTIGKAKF